MNPLIITSCQYDIINIDGHDDNSSCLSAFEEHRVINRASLEAPLLGNVTELLKPRTRFLFQAINRLLEAADHLLPLNNITWRLFHKYRLSEVPVEKGILHIELPERPSLVDGNRKKNPNRRHTVLTIATPSLQWLVCRLFG